MCVCLVQGEVGDPGNDGANGTVGDKGEMGINGRAGDPGPPVCLMLGQCSTSC